MGCKELIESLRKAADEKAAAIWTDAEAEAAAAREAVVQGLAPVREDYDRRKARAVAAVFTRTLSEAQSAARRSRLESERAVAERLYGLASMALPRLRGPDYEHCFGALARELPKRTWKTVRVNPADEALARAWFPNADVVPDESVSGGMEVATEGRSLSVNNTLEKRLERTWSDLLPLLIQEAYEAVSERSAA